MKTTTIVEGVEITLTAAECMEEFLKQEFMVKIEPGYITYYFGNYWVFQLDLKKKYLWCNYYKVWQVFKDEFGMNYEQIKALHAETVATALNCKDFTPLYLCNATEGMVATALNCKDFTPSQPDSPSLIVVATALNCKDFTQGASKV